MMLILALALQFASPWLQGQAPQTTPTPQGPQTTNPKAATWKVERKSDPITDKTVATAILEGDGGAIVYRCTGRKEEMYFASDVYLGGGPPSSFSVKDVTWRIDNNPAVKTSWHYGQRAVFVPNDRGGKTLLSGILTGQKLVVRAFRYDRVPVDMTFDVSNSEQPLREAWGSC